MSTDELQSGWVTTSSGDWAHARGRLSDLNVCFTDDQGLHITRGDNLPPQAPRTCTHVWGWNDDRMMHVRLDGTTTYVTELVTTQETDADAEQVAFRREDSLTFRTAEGETAGLRLAPDTDHSVLSRAAVAYVIVDGPRLTFLSV